MATPPAGSTYTLAAGTTCAAASVHSTAGVATFNVPASGTCTVNYQLCVGSACDTATLTVTAQQAEPIPTLGSWGMTMLFVLVAGAGVLLLRRLVA